MNRPIGLAATSTQALQRAADAYRELHAANDGSDFSEFSYPDLLTERDIASEGDDRLSIYAIDRELRDRLDDAQCRLKALFLRACETQGAVPMSNGRTLEDWPIAKYLDEALNTQDSHEHYRRLLLAPADRAEVLAGLAEDYVQVCGEDLLRAGWADD